MIFLDGGNTFEETGRFTCSQYSLFVRVPYLLLYERAQFRHLRGCWFLNGLKSLSRTNYGLSNCLSSGLGVYATDFLLMESYLTDYAFLTFSADDSFDLFLIKSGMFSSFSKCFKYKFIFDLFRFTLLFLEVSGS